MNEIALFPLNTVLFPGMPVNLHIFEERYKRMINECIGSRKPFGVVLIANNKSETNPNARPHSIGCTAQITQVQPLGNGEMNITAIGRERFQIVSVLQDRPYLMAEIQPYPFIETSPNNSEKIARQLRSHVNNYLKLLQKFNQIKLPPSNLPESPMGLGYLAAVIVQTPASNKQDLLESHDTETFLNEILKVYHRELTILKATSNPPTGIDYHNVYSLS